MRETRNSASWFKITMVSCQLSIVFIIESVNGLANRPLACLPTFRLCSLAECSWTNLNVHWSVLLACFHVTCAMQICLCKTQILSLNEREARLLPVAAYLCSEWPIWVEDNRSKLNREEEATKKGEKQWTSPSDCHQGTQKQCERAEIENSYKSIS